MSDMDWKKMVDLLTDRVAYLTAKLAAAEKDAERLRDWLNTNSTFYDVVSDGPEACTAGPNIPVLASTSKRIWYHATDDQESYPFSSVIDAAIEKERGNG